MKAIQILPICILATCILTISCNEKDNYDNDDVYYDIDFYPSTYDEDTSVRKKFDSLTEHQIYYRWVGNQNTEEKNMTIEEISALYCRTPSISKLDRTDFFEGSLFTLLFSEYKAKPVDDSIKKYPDRDFYKYSWRLDTADYYLQIYYMEDEDKKRLIPIWGWIMGDDFWYE